MKHTFFSANTTKVFSFSVVLLILFIFNINSLLYNNEFKTAQAQTKEELISQLVIDEFNEKFVELPVYKTLFITNENEYLPFEVSHIEVRNDWARIYITSSPEQFMDGNGNVLYPRFQGAVAKTVNGKWMVFFEGTPEFDLIKPRLPLWLSYLSRSKLSPTSNEINQSQYIEEIDASLPALPWAVGVSWDHNGGFHGAGNKALDFGTPNGGETNSGIAPIFAADEGEIVSKDGTCIYVRRYDDLILFYQHIASSDVNKLNVGGYLRMGDFIGNTTMDSGCGGSTGGHHLHFEYREADDNSDTGIPYSSSLVGVTINEWEIQTTADLVKNQVTVYQDSDDDILHSGCPQRKEVPASMPLLTFYNQKNCTGQTWYTSQLNQLIILPNEFNPYSLNIQDGYSVELYSKQHNQWSELKACYTGDLWDMSKDYYPLASLTLGGDVSSFILRPGACPCEANMVNNSPNNTCEPDSPPPPDELPLPPGPRQEETVKLLAYANYDGSVLFSGKEGFSNRPDAEGYSLEIPDSWSVVTYDQDNGSGNSRCWNSSVSNLQDHSWHLRIQSLQIFEDKDMCPASPPSSPTNQVFLYSNPNYSAQLWAGGVGFHDSISTDGESMKIPAGWSAFVYQGDRREIRAQCFNGNVPNLALTDSWQNKIRGIEVFNTDMCLDMIDGTADVYRLYLNEGFSGDYMYAHNIVEEPDMTPWNYNDKVSSIRIKAGYSIRVWEHNDFLGGSRCFTEDITTVRNDAFDNGVAIYIESGTSTDSRISSFKVYDNHYCDGSPDEPQEGWAYSNSPTAFALTEAENTTQSVTVEWVDSSSDELGFRIYEYDNDGVYTLVGEVDPNVTSFTHTNLQCGTTNNYEIKSYNDWGDSVTPYLVSATTAACALPPPHAPSDLRVLWKTGKSISLAWNDNSYDEDLFVLWVYQGGAFYGGAVVEPNSTSFTIPGLSCDTEYGFEIVAVTNNGYSDDSNYVIASTTNLCKEVFLPTIIK